MIVSQRVRIKLAAKSSDMQAKFHSTRSRTLILRPTIYLIIAMCLISLFACENKKAEDEGDAPQETEKVSALRKEVIAIHDEAMPLMTEIYQSKNRLKDKLNADKASPEEKKQIEDVMSRLDSANQGMRVWMREFSDVKTTGISEDEALANLRKELDKITKVKNDMVSSAAAARAIE
jgi:hypothetical protein